MIAAGALAVAGIAVPVGSAYAATACDVVYATNDWPGGFTANVTIRNLGDPINGWTLRFDFPAGQRVTQGWSANWSQSGATVTATSMPWNGSIPTGGQTSIGFNGSWTGSNPKPTAFSINGVTCGGAPQPQPPTVDLTVPAGPFEAPADVALSATASDPDGTSPRSSSTATACWSTPTPARRTGTCMEDLPAGSYTVQARAYDNANLTATDEAAFTVSPGDRPGARRLTGVGRRGRGRHRRRSRCG